MENDFTAAQTIVVKVGTTSLTHDNGTIDLRKMDVGIGLHKTPVQILCSRQYHVFFPHIHLFAFNRVLGNRSRIASAVPRID